VTSHGDHQDIRIVSAGSAPAVIRYAQNLGGSCGTVSPCAAVSAFWRLAAAAAQHERREDDYDDDHDQEHGFDFLG
jgi:hypothetical protein